MLVALRSDLEVPHVQVQVKQHTVEVPQVEFIDEVHELYAASENV